ncbi:MAG TPA: autotransporter assembly complex family protein [Azospirillaceae bacterium]|nr:autotransporter assembly complex family protein [Azospirillaceae bacterium]
MTRAARQAPTDTGPARRTPALTALLLASCLCIPAPALAQAPALSQAPPQLPTTGEEPRGTGPASQTQSTDPQAAPADPELIPEQSEERERREERTGTRYDVEIQGVEENWLRELLGGISSLMNLRDEPPPSPIGLRSRARADEERLMAALRSEGFYDSSLEVEVTLEPEPAKAVIQVRPGERYRLREVLALTPQGKTLPSGPVDPKEIELEPGEPARGPDIVSAQDALTSVLAKKGYAYARVEDRRLVVDHATRTMDVTFVVDPGPEVRLGTVQFVGLEKLKEKAAQRRIPWKPGAEYRPELLNEGRDELSDLQVFDAVRLRIPDKAPADTGEGPVTVPVTAEVTERERHFIGFGAEYSTADGFGANAYWGHRNLLGGAERFRVGAELSGIGRTAFGDPGSFDYRLTTEYLEPDFLARNQQLKLSALLVSESPEAFSREAAILTALVEREFFKGFTGTAGITFEQSKVTENLQTTKNTLIGFPVGVTWDNSDDLLNPTRGFRVSGVVTPYAALLGDSSSFVIARTVGSLYIPFDEEGRTVAAGRLALGTAMGGKVLNVPADKRFYAGGGGSVRGYGYQRVGPRDPENDPLGGRSLFEVGAEVRFRVTESIGLVPFIDGGNVYTTEYPDLTENLRWGAGLGVRYYSPLGPVRLDVGVPINKQRGDASWQLYISIGQAF